MRVWLLFAVAGALAVAAAAVSATDLALRCAAVAFGVLALLAVLRVPAPWPRWTLAGGCVLFAAAALARPTAADRTDVGWFGYGPPATAQLTALRDTADRWLDRELVAAGVQLGAVVLVFAAVHALPRAERRVRMVATAVVAALVVAGFVLERSGLGHGRMLLDVWPATLTAVAALGALLVAGRRADHRWLVAAGVALVAVQAAVTLSDLSGQWLTVWAYNDWLCADSAFLSPGVRVMATATATATAVPDLGPALAKAATLGSGLAGPALLVAGAARAAATDESLQ